MIARLLAVTGLIAAAFLFRFLAQGAEAAAPRAPDVVLASAGAIGDFIWYDANSDGIQSIGEPGIPNVQLDLYRDDDANGEISPGDTLVMTTTTGADGGYLFGNLPDGVYLVKVLSAGVAGGPLDGLSPVVGNQAQPGPTAPINVSAGYVYRDADFGYRRVPGAGQMVIGDLVWYDGNGDGMRQPGEPGIAGVSVCAVAGSGASTCATTDAAGRYLLTLTAGSYTVAPTGGVPAGLTPSTVSPRSAVVAAGQQALHVDFGYRDASGTRLGLIGNLIFRDANANGVFDTGESPLPGISVDLIRDANGNRAWDLGEPIIATAISGSTLDADGGNYRFSGVPAGNYLVHVSAVNAVLLDYRPAPLGTPGTDGHNQADPYPVTLLAGGRALTADFGYVLAALSDSGMIGNLLWVESDGDGLFGSADVGQAGVTIELSQAGEVIAATTSGAGGQYSFIHLPAGTYSLEVSDDFGVLAGLTPTAPGPTPGQDNHNQAQPYAVTLTDGQYDPTADFGYFRVSRLGAIGDYIWYDADGDGVEDLGERGLPNVRVAAYLDTNSNGVLDAGDTLFTATLTDAAGGYLLTGLPAGAYFVDILDAPNPNGALSGLRHSVGMQSQPDPTAPINLAPGQIYKDADFGYVREPVANKAIVGDLVWYDGDGDGVRRPGEPGIPGVTVAITDVNGARLASAVTDAAGVYRIEVAAGSGYVIGPDWAASPVLAGLRATTSAPAFVPPLAAGQQWLEARFGIGEASQVAQGVAAQTAQGTLLGAIGNLVFLDANRNGVFGTGDAPLAGVTVSLIRDLNGSRTWGPGEPIVATAITSSTLTALGGNYLFSGVPAGNYLVHVNDTAGVLADYARGPLGAAGVDGYSQTDPYPVTLAAGATHLAADFGFYRASGLLAGVIGNQVWGETDGDGLFNPTTGDVGAPGITVALLQDGDTIAATTTGPDGVYAFAGRPAGSYQVTVSDDFGVLSGYAPTVLGPFPGQDNNNQTQPYTITLGSNATNLTADFGYRIGLGAGIAHCAVSVQGVTADLRPGVVISFTIRITNTGSAWITYLPLQLVYTPTYLSYVGATPTSQDNVDDGLIQWRNLVGAYSALAPGATVHVVASFRTVADTSFLPGGRTPIVATVRGAWANPAGPTLLGSLLLVPERSGVASVRIILPTGLTVTGLAARRTPEGAAVAWQTANEARILGFEVLRRAVNGGNSGPWRVVSAELIAAEHAGSALGGDYVFVDSSASPAERYEYQLAVWLLDGNKAMFGPVMLGP